MAEVVITLKALGCKPLVEQVDEKHVDIYCLDKHFIPHHELHPPHYQLIKKVARVTPNLVLGLHHGMDFCFAFRGGEYVRITDVATYSEGITLYSTGACDE